MPYEELSGVCNQTASDIRGHQLNCESSLTPRIIEDQSEEKFMAIPGRQLIDDLITSSKSIPLI